MNLKNLFFTAAAIVAFIASTSGVIWSVDTRMDKKIAQSEIRMVMTLDDFQKVQDIRWLELKIKAVEREIEELEDQLALDPGNVRLQKKIERREIELEGYKKKLGILNGTIIPDV